MRVHAPAAQRDEVARLLDSQTRRLFADLGPPPAADASEDGFAAPPIDAQDEAELAYPDRTLLFTDYRRSQVTLGNTELLDEDRYVALMTRCLGADCELAIAALAAESVSKGARQNALLKAAISALGALAFEDQERAEYLVYHRDWLIRFAIESAAKQEEVLALFETRIGGAAGVEQLGRIASAQWGRSRAIPADGAWERNLAALRSYLVDLGDRSYSHDRFARHPSHLPIFKVLHGLANQLGASMLDEAFTYHMLLRATAGDRVGIAIDRADGRS